MMSSRPDGSSDREDQVSGQDFESDQQGGGGAAVTNVVPLPRPWYGSPAELVPIGTEPSERDEPPAVLTHATDFWGGDSATLERVSELSPVDRPARQPGVRPDPGSLRERQRGQRTVAGASEDDDHIQAWIDVAADSVVGATAASAPLARAASSGRLRRLETVVLAVVALAAGTAAAIMLGAGLAPSRSTRRVAAHTRQLTVTQTIPVRELVVRTVTSSTAERSGRPAHRPASSRRQWAASHGTRSDRVVRDAHTGVPAASGAGEPPAAVASSRPAAPGQTVPVTAPVRAATEVAPSRRASGCAPSVTNGGACSL